MLVVLLVAENVVCGWFVHFGPAAIGSEGIDFSHRVLCAAIEETKSL